MRAAGGIAGQRAVKRGVFYFRVCFRCRQAKGGGYVSHKENKQAARGVMIRKESWTKLERLGALWRRCLRTLEQES